MAEVASANVTLVPKFKNLSGSITSALSGAQGSVNATAETMGKSASSSMGRGITLGGVAGAVSSVVTSAMGVISSSVGSAIKRVDTMANFPRVIESLGYSSDAAASAIQLMSDRINGLPTSLDSITSTTQRLLPITGSIESATAVSLALNDAMLAAGAGTADCERALTQYTQMLAKGKPELEDWRTLQEVMPGQLDQLAKAMIGPTAGSNDLYNALKDGTLTMDQFNDALVILDTQGYDSFASFEEQARNSTKGIGTAITNVQNRVSKALAVIIEAIGSENIANVINKFSSTFVPIGNAIAGVIEKVKPVISGIIDMFKRLQLALSPITTAVKSLVNVFKTFAGYTKTAVLVTLRQLKSQSGDFPDIFVKINEAATKLSAKITALEQPVKEFFGHLTAVAIPVVKALAAAFSTIVGKVSAFAEKVSSSDKPLQTFAASLKTGIVGGITNLAAKLQEKGPFGLIAETASNAAQSLSDVLAPGFAGASEKLSSFATTLSNLANSEDPLGDLAALLSSSIQGALDSMKQKIMESEVFGPLLEKAQPVITAVTNLLKPIGTAGKTIFGTLGTAASTAWDTIKGAFGGFGEEVTDKVDADAMDRTVFDVLGDAIAEFQPLVEAVSKAVTVAIQCVATLANQALSIVLQLIVPIKSAFATMRTQVFESLPKMFEEITPALSGVLTEIGGLAEGIAEPVARILARLTELIAPVTQFLTDVVVAALAGIQSFVETARPGIETLVEKLADFCDAVAPALTTFLEGLGSILSPIAETLGAVAGSVASILASVASEVIDELSATLAPALEDWGTKFSEAGDAIGEACTNIQEGIAGFTSALTKAIEEDDYTELQAWWDDNIGGPIQDSIDAFGADCAAWWDANIAPGIEGIQTGWSNFWTARGEDVQAACDDIKAKFDEWGISEAVETAWSGIEAFVSDPMGACESAFSTARANIDAAAEEWGIKGLIETAWSGVSAVISDPVGTAQDAFSGAVAEIDALATEWGVKGFIETAWAGVSSVIEDPVGSAMSLFDEAVATIDAAAEAWGVKGFIETAWDGVSGVIADPLGTAMSLMDSAVATIDAAATEWGIKGFVENAWNGVSGAISDPLGTAMSLMDGAIATIDSAATNWGIKDAVTSAWSSVEALITDPLEAAKDTVQDIVDTIKGFIDDWGIGDAVTAAWSTVQAAIEDPVQAASDAIDGIIAGIESMFSGINFEWPGIPFPTITVTGGYFNSPFDFEIPSFGIEWIYLAHGGVLDDMTLIGAGEAGAEAVIPLTDPYMRPFVDAIAEGVVEFDGGAGDVYNIYVDRSLFQGDAELQAAFAQFGGALKSAIRRGAVA